jgi:hypothetical protein
MKLSKEEDGFMDVFLVFGMVGFHAFPTGACVHTRRENIHPCATWSHFLSQVGQEKKINLGQAPLEEEELAAWFGKELCYTYLGKTSRKVALTKKF